jgi:DNA-binding NtrC family response regulator
MLVVDDEAAIVFAVRDYFVPQGYEVSAAGDFDEAAALLSEHVYEVAVIDLRLGPGPDTLGLDLVTRVHERHPVPPGIVLISAYGSEAIADEARRRGAVFLEKPVPLPMLSAVIEQLRSSTHPEER